MHDDETQESCAASHSLALRAIEAGERSRLNHGEIIRLPVRSTLNRARSSSAPKA